MPDKQTLKKMLLALVADTDFAERYYGYHAQHRARGRFEGYTEDDIMTALSATGLDFTYNPREKFYAVREQQPVGTIGLNVAFPQSTAEFILVLQVDAQHIGGPFARLANEAARARDPQATFDPPYPKLPFSNSAELAEVTRFGVGLYRDLKHAITTAAAFAGTDQTRS